MFGLLDSSKSTTASSDKVSKGTPLSKSSSVVTSDVSEVVDQVMPSIVLSQVCRRRSRSFFGGTYEQQSKGAGTGIIIGKTDTELLIVTNNHVVAGSDTLTVAFTDESTVEANIKGTIPSMMLQLLQCLLRIFRMIHWMQSQLPLWVIPRA